MPSVNLRLTDEQHASLVAQATREGRSLQRQIVQMIFETSVPVAREGDAAFAAKPFRGMDAKPSQRK